MAKLKVFCTPIGFHDAYVAAPSQKAALQAWVSDADLFARGIAEKVTDPKLMEAPLEKPGVVIKVSRGTAADHFETKEPTRPADRTSKKRKTVREAEKADSKPAPAPPKPKKKIPRPSRAKLEAAEQAVDQATADLKEKLADIDARKRALDAERRTLRADNAKHVSKLEAARDRARKDYQGRLEKWANR
ncbi:hypothetical protein [Sphingobium limneticum]|uniref:Cell envelope biogenesis protein TolA n=1 Tax=Sphingobium limneticum TaxID=1007511 RepID=A0A5J5IA10_9SPHN|nr:hypothetical protein [Sphingobium limneticum]KAA9019623.1 hypothetical protein F4U96_05070 [Sphingobium limneticum]KAA9032081.1 hypothetical protein F4U95_05070 [Sphingobium limneticum]